MSRDLVRVRAIRPHDTADGMKAPGDEYDRTREDADHLSARGVVEIVASKPASKPASKRK